MSTLFTAKRKRGLLLSFGLLFLCLYTASENNVYVTANLVFSRRNRS